MKLSRNGWIALFLLGLGWLILLFGTRQGTAVGGLLIMSVIAGAMLWLMR